MSEGTENTVIVLYSRVHHRGHGEHREEKRGEGKKIMRL
jgi:hypothetical protein